MDIETKRFVFLLFIQLTLYCTLYLLDRDKAVIAIWTWEQMCSVWIRVLGEMATRTRRPCRLWAHERGLFEPGFFDRNLLGSFIAREFKGRMRMNVFTFEFLCSTLAPVMHRQDTNMRSAVLVQVKVAVAISRLATGNSMRTIADLYRVGLSTSQLAVS